MYYDVITTANSLFISAKKQHRRIKSLKQLQLLLFLTQYFYLKCFKEVLISDTFYKTRDYPYVYIPSLSRIVNHYNLLIDSNIHNMNEDSGFVNGGDIIIPYPYYKYFKSSESINRDNIEWNISSIESKEIDVIIKAFGNHTTLQLKNILAGEKGNKLKYNENTLNNMLTIDDIMNCDFGEDIP